MTDHARSGIRKVGKGGRIKWFGEYFTHPELLSLVGTEVAVDDSIRHGERVTSIHTFYRAYEIRPGYHRVLWHEFICNIEHDSYVRSA